MLDMALLELLVYFNKKGESIFLIKLILRLTSYFKINRSKKLYIIYEIFANYSKKKK